MSKLSTTFEEVQLVYRNKTKAANRPKIECANDAFKILYSSWNQGQLDIIEECKLLLLDNSLRLMSIASISRGGMSATVVDPRIIFATALKRRAHSMILAHNHPTGNLMPSSADLNLTKRVTEIGEVLNIRLNDHLIITSEGFRSIISDEIGGLDHV